MCLKLAWAQKAVYKNKIVKQTKKIYKYIYIYCTSMSFYLWSIKKIRMFMFFAVTLLFILLTLSFTRDSFLSLCQSPMPPHFCTDNVKQSAGDEGLTL